MNMKRIMQESACVVMTSVVMACMSEAACAESEPSGPAVPATPVAAPVAASNERELQAGLVAHWKLQGDCRDYSGHGNHGVNHGVGLENGTFDGVGAYIEVPA